MLLNKTCSHLPFLKYMNIRQVAGILGSFFPGLSPCFSCYLPAALIFPMSLIYGNVPVACGCRLGSTGSLE